MKKFNVFILIFLLMVSIAATAQKRKKTVVKKNTAPAVVDKATAMYKSMLHATAKVMFIDSVSVDKKDFLKHIPLNKESGKIEEYNKFFNVGNQPNSTVYTNEFANRCYFAKEDTVYGNQLYAMDKLGDKWDSPQALNGIDDEFTHQNYPFMMADGITLLFAAKGEKSLGGYDIFMTLYDSENDKFYTPENYGLPYNSKANDYLVAYDELDTLGWLVSDRYQPEGRVCIYTFVPTFPRISFGDDISEQQLDNYAQLASIKDTWAFGNKEAAEKRLKHLLQSGTNADDGNIIPFVINDDITYNNINDFRSPTNRKLYLQLTDMIKSQETAEKTLEDKRMEYHHATSNARRGMKTDLLSQERETEQMRTDIHQMVKKIRNTENLLLK